MRDARLKLSSFLVGDPCVSSFTCKRKIVNAAGWRHESRGLFFLSLNRYARGYPRIQSLVSDMPEFIGVGSPLLAQSFNKCPRKCIVAELGIFQSDLLTFSPGKNNNLTLLPGQFNSPSVTGADKDGGDSRSFGVRQYAEL